MALKGRDGQRFSQAPQPIHRSTLIAGIFGESAISAVNKDYPEEQKGHQGFSRKLKADMFIDDRNLGGLPDWGVIYEMIKEKKTFADIYSQNGEEEKTSLKKKKRWLPF